MSSPLFNIMSLIGMASLLGIFRRDFNSFVTSSRAFDSSLVSSWSRLDFFVISSGAFDSLADIDSTLGTSLTAT